MAVEHSEGEGRYIGCQASTTQEIPAGRIVEYDSSGYIDFPTTIIDQYAGISATKKAAQTTAALKDITVQQTGLAPIRCTATEGFSKGDHVRGAAANGDATAAADATTVSTPTALAQVIGRVVVPDTTTTGTTVVVQLGV